MQLRLADEANELMDWKDPDASEKSLKELLNFFVAISKQKSLAHVILATSDFFLAAWLLSSTICYSMPLFPFVPLIFFQFHPSFTLVFSWYVCRGPDQEPS